MMFKADMHVHSTCSDGSATPKELIDLAVESGLSGLSITDHDTIAAYSKEFLSYAKEKNIKLISGVEFSCQHKNMHVHLLAYGFDPNTQELLDLCKRHSERRKTRNLKILEKLDSYGMPIDEKETL